MRIRALLHILLGLLTVALFWQVTTTWRRPLPVPLPLLPPPPKEAQSLPFPAPQTPEAMATQVALIASKDLFSPIRGREDNDSPQPDTPAPTPPPSHLKLVGVLLSRAREEALFADASQGGKVVRVKQGDTIGSYQLLRVTPAEVKLSLGSGGGEASLPLLILDSGKASQAPRLLPAPVPQPVAGQGRPGQVPARSVLQPADANQQAASAANVSHEEAQALRENIQKMQQRLRRIRRKAAREEAGAQGEERGGEDEEDEADEE